MEDEMLLTGDPCGGYSVPLTPTPIATADCCPECTTDEPKMCSPHEDQTYSKFTELVEILQDSVLHAWKMHLKAKKYYVHVILEDYYNEALEIIDGLIEHYQGICMCDVVNIEDKSMKLKSDDPYTYFRDIKDYLVNFVNDSNNFNDKTFEIKSDIDDLLRLIDSTLYKLGNLTESRIKTFEEFVYERKR